MSTTEYAEMSARFERALLVLDRLAAREILQAQDHGAPATQRVEQIVVPALERIGIAWEQGHVALSQVYMSGRICEGLVDEILPPGAPIRKAQPKMAIAILEDHHLLGKRIVYSMLRASGFELLDYGAGISAEELATRVLKDGVKILLISTLMLPSALHVKRVRERLNGAGVKIVVGGAPFLFDAQLWKEVGADAMGHSAADAILIVSKLMEAQA